MANLEQNWDQAVQLTTAGRARVWRLYMAGSALDFRSNRLGINQVLAVKPGPAGASGLPRTRTEMLRGADTGSMSLHDAFHCAPRDH